jgi:hypothetical protein
MTADKKASRSGLSQEEAFKRWCDPATYEIWAAHQDAWQSVSMAEGVPPNEAVLRHQAYAHALEALQEQLRAMLIEGEVLASGIRKVSDGRSVIKPSSWEDMEFSDDFDEIYANGMIFTKPRYFTATDIPVYIEDHPKWLSDLINAKKREHPPALLCSADYRNVTFGGQEFVFGDLQAKVVGRLHLAFQSSDPWCQGKTILFDIGAKSANIGVLFKSQRNWKTLIESDGRGKYRLRLNSSAK